MSIQTITNNSSCPGTFMSPSHQKVLSITSSLKYNQSGFFDLLWPTEWDQVLFKFWTLGLKQSGIVCFYSNRALNHHVKTSINPSGQSTWRDRDPAILAIRTEVLHMGPKTILINQFQSNLQDDTFLWMTEETKK